MGVKPLFRSKALDTTHTTQGGLVMTVYISIETGNEAFSEVSQEFEIARILGKLANQFENYEKDLNDCPITLHDINGNSVGKVMVSHYPNLITN